MPTENLTRTYRRGSETGLSGSEAITVEVGQTPVQTIDASAEEEVTVSFIAHLLQSIQIQCDQVSSVQVLETRYAITASVAGPPGTITTAANDLTEAIFPGDLVRVEGSAGDDGVYLVVSVGAGPNLITLENGQSLPAGGGDGTVARVANTSRIGYAYDIVTTTLGTGAIVIAGNVTDKFSALDYLQIQGTVANDGMWEIDADPVFAAGNTTIIVNTVPGGAAGLPATEGAVGTITRILPSIQLAANTPFMWSIDSGIQNPFINPSQAAGVGPEWFTTRGIVVAMMVTNAATNAASFTARLGTNSAL